MKVGDGEVTKTMRRIDDNIQVSVPQVGTEILHGH